jgi:hypothetical protein
MHLTTLLPSAKQARPKAGLRRRLEQFDNDLLLLCGCGDNPADGNAICSCD